MLGDKMYEIEIQRSNITPKQFFTYCKKQAEKKGISLTNWCESFEEWIGSDGRPAYNISTFHDDWETPVLETCKTCPYDWHMFLGHNYNFIMEFQFDDEKKGFGYLYMIEFER